MQRMIGIGVDEELKKWIQSFRRICGQPAGEPAIELVPPGKMLLAPGLEQRLQSFCLAQPVFPISYSLAHSKNAVALCVLPGNITILKEKLTEYLSLKREHGIYKPHAIVCQLKQDAQDPLLVDQAKAAFPPGLKQDVDSLVLYQAGKDGIFKLARTFYFTGR